MAARNPIRIKPGAQVALHQAFRCCPYAALITARLHDFFVQNGCGITADSAAADLQVINTCGFNESRTLQALDAIGRHRERGPDSPMVIVGCLPGIAPERVTDALDPRGQWLLLGPHDHDQLDGLLTDPGVPFAQVQTNLYHDRYSRGDPRMGLYQVLVSTGCLNQCTYCVIRHAKGSVRSRPLADITAEVERAEALGHQNVLLVGDDVSAWGADRGSTVVRLLDTLTRTEGALRFSVEALEPSRLLPHLDDLTAVFARDRFAWIVFPVQSGSDRVLAAMGRRYTRAQVEQALARLRSAAPEMFISTDMIFGFGDETEAEFEQTLELGGLFDHCDFNEYEQRPGTPPCTVDPEQLQRRRERVSAYQQAQGEQAEKLVFCELVQTPPGASTGLPEGAAPGHGSSPGQHGDGAPTQWVVAHQARVGDLVTAAGHELTPSWRVEHVDVDTSRVILRLSHTDHREPLAFMLTPRDPGTPAIAASADYNLGLIWDRPTPALLDAEQQEALSALQVLLGLEPLQT